jgi:AcrR family transcriptional regulator
VSTPYEANGRIKQKQRTRVALIRAAQELVAAGHTPTVEQVATAAGVSRAVGYRYFPNQHALLAAAHPETAATTLLPPNPPADPAERLALVVQEFTSLIIHTESQQRTMLRLSLDGDNAARTELPLRQGRAIGWISEALAPLHGQLTDQQLHHLTLAIRSAIGIEALAWQTDVAQLTRDESVALMSWTAQALLYAATSWQPPDLPNQADGSPTRTATE